MATKTQLEAAKARAAAATKAYQNTPSYAANYAEVKQENDSAINALNKIQSEIDAANAPKKKTVTPSVPTTDTAPSLDELQTQLTLATTRRSNASNDMDLYSTDSAEYKQAKSDFDKYTKQIDSVKAKISDSRSTQQVTTKTEKAKLDANQAAAAQKALDEAIKKAKDRNIDPASDPKVAEAQKNLDAKKVISTKSGTNAVSTSDTAITNGKLNASQTAAFNAVVAKDTKSTKPTPTPTPTPTPKPKPTPTPATTAITADDAQAKAEAALANVGNMGTYAVQMSLINSDPSLKELFYNDVYLPILNGKSPVDPAKFKADLQNTNWFKNYAEPAREAEAIKSGDPATWAVSVQAATDLINREATAAGYTITPEQATTLAEFALHKSGGKAEAISGLTLTDVQLQLKNVGKINASGGQAATDVSTLKAFAGDYAIAHLYNDATLTGWADQIAKGKTTLAAVEKQMKDTAISSYSALAPQINAGLTVKSIISPYTQLYGTTLEVDPNAQDLSDPTFANTIFTKDAKDPNIQVLKPLWQYQSDLKKDPRWAYTDNARQSLDSVAHNVLKDMGFKY